MGLNLALIHHHWVNPMMSPLSMVQALNYDGSHHWIAILLISPLINPHQIPMQWLGNVGTNKWMNHNSIVIV